MTSRPSPSCQQQPKWPLWSNEFRVEGQEVDDPLELWRANKCPIVKMNISWRRASRMATHFPPEADYPFSGVVQLPTLLAFSSRRTSVMASIENRRRSATSWRGFVPFLNGPHSLAWNIHLRPAIKASSVHHLIIMAISSAKSAHAQNRP